jgi:hypothetical protein
MTEDTTMTPEQKAKVIVLQAAYQRSAWKARQATTIAERDATMRGFLDGLLVEPDRDVQKAVLLWMMRRVNLGETAIAWPYGTEITKSDQIATNDR